MNPCKEYWGQSPDTKYHLCTLYSNNESGPLELANWTIVSCHSLILASFSESEFQPIWSWQVSRAYPVISWPSSCPYQDSVHIEFWMFCVGCVCFLFVSFWILKQWGGASMWPSCLNNFLTNPGQKGQTGDWVVWSDHSVLQWWLRLSHFKSSIFKENCGLKCINRYFQSCYTDDAILMAAAMWNNV